MRHATDRDLDRIEGLLGELRRFSELGERRRGTFQLRSRAFLHFHSEGEDLFADVRLDGEDFTRMGITSRAEQRALVKAIRSTLQNT